MSTTKSSGSSKLGRDSRPKYLGVKITDGTSAKAGQILIRQRGTSFYPGKNVRRAKDDTLFALLDGIVRFTTRKKRNFDRSQRIVKVINVLPA